MMPLAMRLAGLASAMLSAPRPSPAPDPRHSLMPVPASLEWREGSLRLDRGIVVQRTPPETPDPRLSRAVDRFRTRLGQRTGMGPAEPGAAEITLRVRGPGEPVQSLTEDERYTLEVDRAGVRLEAATTVGALRGLETLLQLVSADSSGWYLPAVHIEDAPRFPWRGLMIDVGRHFEPADVIKRQLDGMAAVKLNVLHWHLSEDQGFRVESRRYPLLHQKGSDGLYYTQAEIREVVAYARDRGIRVVPEFDMPGHSSAWFPGYPEYASGPGPYSIERRFGVFAPTFDPTREETYRFLEGFIAEMTGLFPDRYWHIGGDEVEGSQWRSNPRIRAFMRGHDLADNGALQAYFNRRLSAILTRHGRRMVGWDEILHRGLPATTVIHSWRGQASLADAARQGLSGILSSGYYLDHMRTAEAHYLVDPLPEGSGLTPEQARRVLGGEACMWHEQVTPASIDSRIWPRMAAIAERLWSPGEVRDVPDMYRRLAVMRIRLEALGLGSEVHTPRMARQVADGHDATALTALLQLVEPVSFGERANLQRLTQLIPLSFVVDAARPDPPAHWELRWLAFQAGGTGPEAALARSDLLARFAAWTRLLPAIDSLAREAPRAGDALPAARALARLAGIGTDALARREAGRATTEWVQSQTAILDSLAAPQGLLRLVGIPAVRRLVLGGGPP